MRRPSRSALGLLALLAACGIHSADEAAIGGPPPDAGAADAGADGVANDAGPGDPFASGPPLGARRHPDGDLEIRVRAPRAERVEVCLFAAQTGEVERLRLPLDPRGDGLFTLRVAALRLAEAGLGEPLFYGLRAFGPNWRYDPAFTPGSLTGFVRDVDDEGNRFDPNKLLLDPYALEVSHDPITLTFANGAVYRTGEGNRQLDSGPFAPKGVVLPSRRLATTSPPARHLRDDVVYEVHLRGFTMADASVPEAERGTYAGAARRAAYLKSLGVTAIELLPLHETPNDQNERTPDASGDNMWGYSTLSFFAPDRRYAKDRSPGGPTRELAAMVDAFHAEGIKVFVDVVYNHTAEGGAGGDAATLYSLRGLDNATFYELADDAHRHVDNNGVGSNVNTANPVTADLVVASLRYWHELLGVDGFRFDLASVVGNGCTRGCFRFDKGGLLTRIAKELPSRTDDGARGVDLVAEPWGIGAGTYQVGNFPPGWAEWNDRFRDTVRRDLNRLGADAVTPRELARRIQGSPDLYGDDGRGPAASINYVVSHDGMTLADLFAYDVKQNDQPWPYGPSSGGTDSDLAFSHGGDPARQRGAARTALALVALSAGVPMFTGGDERLRTVRGNNNPYNLDSVGAWLDWTPTPERDAFTAFTAKLLAFRHAHPALRPAKFSRGADVTWLRDDGVTADDAYLDAADRHALGWTLDGATPLTVFYNGWSGTVLVTPPAPPAGKAWKAVFDTSEAAESWGNAGERDASFPYALGRRSVLVLVAK